MRLTTLPGLGLIATLAAAATAAQAAPLLIDFETPTSYASIAEHYNGGTDSAGVAGPNLGVSFGADLLALQNDDLGPYFAQAPSPLGVMFVAGSGAAVVNVAAGFTTGLVLSYASSAQLAQAVAIYSGLDGTGQLLASIDLAANAQADGCSTAPYCHFDTAQAGFNGTARSISFGNAVNVAAFDDLRIGAVPEPTSALIVALGLGALALTRRRA